MPAVIYFDYVLVKVRNVKLNLSSSDTSRRQSVSTGRSFTVSAVPESLEVSYGLTTQAQSDWRGLLREREEGVVRHRPRADEDCFQWVEREGNKARGCLPLLDNTSSQSPFPPHFFTIKLLCSKALYSLKIY